MARPKYKDGTPIPSAKAKRAVHAILSGEAKSLKAAAKKAGYSESTSNQATIAIFKQQSVINYLKRIDKISLEKFGLSIQDKVMETYFNGMEATKLYGKNAKEHPDFRTRNESADRFAKLFGWDKNEVQPPEKQGFNQFNFFNVKPEEQKAYNEKLKDLIKKSYA